MIFHGISILFPAIGSNVFQRHVDVQNSNEMRDLIYSIDLVK
jgi:hypothetical protein